MKSLARLIDRIRLALARRRLEQQCYELGRAITRHRTREARAFVESARDVGITA